MEPMDEDPVILVLVPRKATNMDQQLIKSPNCNQILKALISSNFWTDFFKYIQTKQVHKVNPMQSTKQLHKQQVLTITISYHIVDESGVIPKK